MVLYLRRKKIIKHIFQICRDNFEAVWNAYCLRRRTKIGRFGKLEKSIFGVKMGALRIPKVS